MGGTLVALQGIRYVYLPKYSCDQYVGSIHLKCLGDDKYETADHAPEREGANWSSGHPGSRIDPLGPGKSVTFFPVDARLAASKSFGASDRSYRHQWLGGNGHGISEISKIRP